MQNRGARAGVGMACGEHDAVAGDGRVPLHAGADVLHQIVADGDEVARDECRRPLAIVNDKRLGEQVVVDADYVDADCFAKPCGPVVVPARTFLSQLL